MYGATGRSRNTSEQPTVRRLLTAAALIAVGAVAASNSVDEAAAATSPDTVLVSGVIDFADPFTSPDFPVPTSPTPPDEARYSVYATKVAFDQSGQVYVRDFDTIVQVDPATGVTQRVAGFYPGGLFPPPYTIVPDGIGDDSLTVGLGWSRNLVTLDDGRMLFDNDFSGSAPQVFSAPIGGGPIEVFAGDGTTGVPVPGAQASATPLDGVNAMFGASNGAAWIVAGSGNAHLVATDGTISTQDLAGSQPLAVSVDTLLAIGFVQDPTNPSRFEAELRSFSPSGAPTVEPITGDCATYFPAAGAGATATSLRYIAERDQAPFELVECVVDLGTGISTVQPLDADLAGWLGGSDDGSIEQRAESVAEWDPLSESWWFVGRSSQIDTPFGYSLGLYRHTPAAPVTDASITVGVATSPAAGAGTVTFGGAVTATLGDQQQSSPLTVAPGATEVTFSTSAGWAAAGVVCDDDDSTGDTTTGAITFQTDPGEDVSCVVAIAPTTADVSLVKTADQNPVIADGTLSWTFRVSNAGPGVAADVIVVDFVPPDSTFVSATAGCSHDGAATGGEVTCTVGNVAPGEIVDLSIVTTAGPVGERLNTGSVVTTSNDPDGTNNGTSAAADVVAVDPNPCLVGVGNELWAHGSNYMGGLAVLAPGQLPGPQPVNRLSGVIGVDNSGGSIIAIHADGLVCSWGARSSGGLGRPLGETAGFNCESPGRCTPIPAPVLLSGGGADPYLRDVVDVAGRASSFAVVDPDGDGTGELYAWGWNGRGDLEPGVTDGTIWNEARPVSVPGGGEVSEIGVANDRVVVLTDDGRIVQWGYEFAGGSWSGRIWNTSIPLRSDEQVEHLIGGFAITDQNRIFCTRLGGSSAVCPSPAIGDWMLVVDHGTGVDLVVDAATDSNTGSLGTDLFYIVDGDVDGDGQVWTINGRLGDGTRTQALGAATPTALSVEATQVSTNGTSVLAVSTDGVLWGWGGTGSGQLGGAPTNAEVLSPVVVGGYDGVSHAWALRYGAIVDADTVAPTTLLESTYAQLFEGESVTTDSEGDGATFLDPVETTITLIDEPVTSAVALRRPTINESPLATTDTSQAVGFQAWGQAVSIAVPHDRQPGAVPATYDVDFALYLTPIQQVVEEAFGSFVSSIQISRNGSRVADCVDATVPDPDPCVTSRTYEATTGNAIVSVRTTQFSRWTFDASAPVVDLAGPYSAVEGDDVQIDGTVTSAAGPATLDWSPVPELLTDPTSASPVFTPPDDGIWPLELRAEAAGIAAEAVTEVIVTNADPVISNIDVQPAAAPLNDPVNLTVDYTDPGTSDRHTITVDWGDGTTVTKPSDVAGGGSLDVTHTYMSGTEWDVTVTVTDDDGGTASRAFTIAAQLPQYDFDGFFAPVRATPAINRVNAGRAIPIKFSLGGDFGPDVLADGAPSSRRVSCTTWMPSAAADEAVAAGRSSLSYNARQDVYRFVWKTDRAWSGQCREFVLELDDGSTHTPRFRFR